MELLLMKSLSCLPNILLLTDGQCIEVEQNCYVCKSILYIET